MKNKIYIVLIFLLTVFIPFGCNKHSYQTEWTMNETHHWHTCLDCDEIVNKSEHTFENNTCSVCNYKKNNQSSNETGSENNNNNNNNNNENGNNNELETTEDEMMNKFFYELQYTKLNSTHKDATGNTTTWYDLVNNQIDAFSKDLLYRLTYVYGSNSQASHNKTSNFYTLTKQNGSNYDYGPYKAYVISEIILSETDFNNKNDFFFNGTLHQSNPFDLNCIDCYQTSMVDYSTDNSNYLYSSNYLNLLGAIEGRNTSISGSQLSLDRIDENSWNWWDNSLSNSHYTTYIEKYKNSLKMAVVEILSNTTPTAIYNEESYSKMIDGLLEFKISNYKDQITDFVLNTIIGKELVEKDNLLYNSEFFVNNNYMITEEFSQLAPLTENSPRLFKAYTILVTQLVEKATLNEFRFDDGDPLDNHKNAFYKTTKLSSSIYGQNYVSTDSFMENQFNTITIKQKTGVFLTTLVLDIKGTENCLNKEFKIDLEVVINGVTHTITKNITLSSDPQRLEFDLKSITEGLPTNAYNSTTDYIKFNFNNVYGYNFAISFIKMKAE